MLDTCTLAVLAEMNSSAAISRLLRPAATSSSTSSSRAVRPSGAAPGASPAAPGASPGLPPVPLAARSPTARSTPRDSREISSLSGPARSPAASVAARRSRVAAPSRSPAARAARAAPASASASWYGCRTAAQAAAASSHAAHRPAALLRSPPA